MSKAHVTNKQISHKIELTSGNGQTINQSSCLDGGLELTASDAQIGAFSTCSMSEVSNLLNVICHNDGAGRVEAAVSLVNTKLCAGDVSQLLMVYNNTHDDFVHCVIIRSLRNAGSLAKPAEAILLRALEHPAGDIRHSAMSALGCLKQNASIQTIAKLSNFLSHENSLDRYQAAQSLADIGSPARHASLKLSQLLNDPKPSIRLIAIHALTEVASPSDTKVEECLASTAKSDEDEDVRSAAKEALTCIHANKRIEPSIISRSTSF